MKTIAQWWDQFKTVLDPKAPPVQVTEMRRAFYAGYQSCLAAGLQMADESKDNDDIGATMIQRQWEECRAFAESVRRGEA